MSTPPNGEGVPPATDKEIVVYRDGWGFRLPEWHTVTLTPDRAHAALSVPHYGSVHVVEQIRETEGEYRIYVGDAVGTHGVRELGGYPFPTIDQELDRLKADHADAGGTLSAFNAWRPGASHDSHTSDLRAEIRRLRALG